MSSHNILPSIYLLSNVIMPSLASKSSLTSLCIIAQILLTIIDLSSVNVVVQANPKSRPYVAYRTSPFDQDDFVSRRIMEDGVEQRGGDGGR